MRALLFSIAVLTVTPVLAAPPSDFWFDQMEQETGTPDIGGAPDDFATPDEDVAPAVDVTSCRWTAEECAQFDLNDPEDARDIRRLNELEDLEASIAKADLIMFGQPRSTLTQEQLDAMDALDDGEE